MAKAIRGLYKAVNSLPLPQVRKEVTSCFKTHLFVILSVAKDPKLLKMRDSSLRYASFRMTNLKIMGF
jgi:hypothetical protein